MRRAEVGSWWAVAAVIALLLTLSGCNQQFDPETVQRSVLDVTEVDRHLYDAEVWTTPDQSGLTGMVGVRLYVENDDPAEIAEIILAVSKPLVEGIPWSDYTVTFNAVVGGKADYADHFDIVAAQLRIMDDVAVQLDIAPDHEDQIEISAKTLKRFSDR
jgi:hypothetical protein